MMATRSKVRDKSMSKLGNRMVSFMLKNEKKAEKELEQKMKALKEKEHKSIVKICETSLDVKYDCRRQRNTQAMEGRLLDDQISLGVLRSLQSPNLPRRGSLVAMEGTGEESRKTESTTNPAILINNESDDGGEKDVDRGRSPESNGLFPNDPPPPGETVINEEEAQKLLKVFSQSSRGTQRRRSAPEAMDLSPKLLIQLAKSSHEIKRQGTTLKAAAAMNPDEKTGAPATKPLHTGGRVSPGHVAEQENKEEEPVPPGQSGRLCAIVSDSSAERSNHLTGSPRTLRRRSFSCNKSLLSIETNEILLREKISEQAPLSPRLKQPHSPLLGRRGSGMAVASHALSSQPPTKDPTSEPILPGLTRPQSPRPSLRRTLSPFHGTQPASPPAGPMPPVVSGSADLGEWQLHDLATENDLPRRRGSCSNPAVDSCHPSARRGSALLSQIDLSGLSPSSPLRKAMENPQTTLNPAPALPNVYKRHSVATEALQGRVDDFLKALATKGS